MYQTALLLLSGPIRLVIESIGQYLKFTDKRVAKRLYIRLEPDLTQPFKKSDAPHLKRLSSVVPTVYSKASSICKNIDVRLLIGTLDKSKAEQKSVLFEAIFSNEIDSTNVNTYIEQNFGLNCNDIVIINKFANLDQNDHPESEDEYTNHKTVVLGGTFDRLHNGHKVLLTEAVLKATDKVIIGVSTGSTLKKKVLHELIEPIEKRMEDVRDFLKDVDPSLCYDIVPITDVYGPTITDPNIDCIVVTTETKVGGDKVNEERKKRGMKELEIYVVNLVENTEHTFDEDEKLSSSTNRMHLLGKPFKNIKPTFLPGKPYCILFQGHPAYGKNIVCSRLQALGVPVLCCDDMLHAIVAKDENFKETFSKQFPEDTSLSEDNNVDFNKMLDMCIKDNERRDWLGKYVFVKVKSALHQVFQVYKQQGIHVIIINDSTIFEGWDLGIEVHEIWATMYPLLEASKLLKEYYNISDSEALELVEYFNNEKYVKRANIVFCSKWSSEFLQEQVNIAYSYLKTNQDTS